MAVILVLEKGEEATVGVLLDLPSVTGVVIGGEEQEASLVVQSQGGGGGTGCVRQRIVRCSWLVWQLC